MSKQAIALLQAERDHVASAGMDFGGRLSDEDSSTVANYDDAIEAFQKLVSERDELASRVRELTDCLEWVRGYIGRYDPPGLPNHVVQKIDEAARNASKEQQ